MTKNASRGLIVLAIVLAVFSLIAFAIPFAHTAVFWIAYGFGVLAILFQLYIFKTSFAGNGDAKSRFYGFPIARLGIYYLVAQLILSVIEFALAGLIPAWPAIIVNVLVLAFVLIAVFDINTAYVILLFIVIGIIATFAGGSKAVAAAEAEEKEKDGGGDGE